MSLRDRIAAAAKDMWRGHWINRDYDVRMQMELLRDETPIEHRAAYDMAIERGDFVRATDVIRFEWQP